MRNKQFSRYFALLMLIGLQAEMRAQTNGVTQPPRLVINIVVDQLRTDYLEAFAPLYGDGGFKHLLGRGRTYNNASYAFTPVDRASAVACIATGATPYYNSIVGRQWLNRETLRPVMCVDDSRFGGLMTIDASSAEQLKSSTLGDELKVATEGKAIVYAIAPNRDAAVLSAGHAADGALWIDSRSGEWCSSSYYFHDIPSWILAHNTLHSPNKKIGSATWEPTTKGQTNYLTGNTGERPFHHKFNGERRFVEYKASALVNADITAMAEQAIANMMMGSDKATDLLSLTYYAGNYDHRPAGECPLELQDTYVKLDAQIARLISYVEQRIGRGFVLLTLTSTGCADEESADYAKWRIPTGTFYLNRTAQLMNMYFGAIWGQAKYVEGYYHNQIFLDHKLLEEKRITLTEATLRAQELLSMMQGVKNVYTSLQLLTISNEYTLATRNGYNPDHCGDVIIEVAPGWRVLNEDTGENDLQRASFMPFPIIFYGAGLQPEQINTPVEAHRIAPTLARAIRIRAPNACKAAPLF